MALLAWRLGSGKSNQQDDCFQPAVANRQMWRGVQLPEFTCRFLELREVEGLRTWLPACPTSGPKEPSERAPKRKQEPFKHYPSHFCYSGLERALLSFFWRASDIVHSLS